jgi:RNA:NAD 2'-phosphotransferase (TPT1/KptA family)
MTTYKTKFHSVHLTDEARDRIKAAAISLTSPSGRRVSMSDALIAAVEVAMRHTDEMVIELADAEDVVR